MCVVNAAVENFNHVIVFPGEQLHYQNVRGTIETVHSYLLEGYLYQGEYGSVDSSIFFGLSKDFCRRDSTFARSRKNMLLSFNGYVCHIQHYVLQFLKEPACILSEFQSIRRICYNHWT